jgi:hypothetical protein
MPVHLKDEKVEHLAVQLASAVKKCEDAQVLGDQQTLIHTITETIFDDLAAEEDLEDEVKELLEKALAGQSRDSVNYPELFKKAKAELARKKDFIL